MFKNFRPAAVQDFLLENLDFLDNYEIRGNDNMKNILMGLLTFLLICSTGLNAFMFVKLEQLLGNSPQGQISSNVNSSTQETPLVNSSQVQPSAPESNATTSNFNTALIGSWTDGRKTKFHVMEDGTAYEVTHAEWDDSGGEFVNSIIYGYMDGNNFVATKQYSYNSVINGGDGIFRYSDEEVIANYLHDTSIGTYRIILEGNTITGFGDTNLQFVKASN